MRAERLLAAKERQKNAEERRLGESEKGRWRGSEPRLHLLLSSEVRKNSLH